MYEVYSQTISEDYKASEVEPLEWKFQLNNGNTGVMTVSDPLLETETIATERAKSEFLKNGYRHNEVKFTTYLTDIEKNDLINVHGLNYLVKSITTTITPKSIKSTIRAIRYD